MPRSAAPTGAATAPATKATATSAAAATAARPARMNARSVATAGPARRMTAWPSPRRSTRRPRSGAKIRLPVIDAASTRLALANDCVASRANSTNATGVMVCAVPIIRNATTSRGTPGVRSTRAYAVLNRAAARPPSQLALVVVLDVPVCLSLAVAEAEALVQPASGDVTLAGVQLHVVG